MEYFNAEWRRRRGMPDYPDDPGRQIEKVLELGVTPNGVYALKIFPFQADEIRATRWAEALPNLAFVYLERGDLLGQAISFIRAEQTEQWRHEDPVKGERRYDPAGIARALRNLAVDQARWRSFFARTGIEPLMFRYEEIVADPQLAVDGVAALMGVESVPVRAEDAAVRMQRDAVSDDWRARFVHNHGTLSQF
jgi:trehalose 2-sulfotransferase